jgi:adenylate cyclase
MFDMPEPPNLRILENHRAVLEVELAAPLEIGRQRTGEPEPYQALAATDTAPARLIIARQGESNISRQHLTLHPLPGGRIRVRNGSRLPVPRGDGVAALAPGESLDLDVPFFLVVESRVVVVVPSQDTSELDVRQLDNPTLAPGSRLASTLARPPQLDTTQFQQMLLWLQEIVGVLQSAVGSPDFRERAAQTLVESIKLDVGLVLRMYEGEWIVEADYGLRPGDSSTWRPSGHVLGKVLQTRHTHWQRRHAGDGQTWLSTHGLDLIVASPLLDDRGEVIGALYGEHRVGSAVDPVSDRLQAVLVDLLASGVSAGMARQGQQEERIRLHARFAQFFTSELALQLEREPKLLEGRDAEITVLFCDVRSFSRYSEKLGPARTVAFLNDLMNELSPCVLDQEGVLVDYIGDELMAMWGAPRPQPDQAVRAVLAALAMRDRLAALSRRWSEALGEPVQLGIGVNTGEARVGNTGSQYKFKYGPLGNTVNLASRVQGLTKYLRCPLLVTAATRAGLDDRFLARRVCKTRVVNITTPVDLYEVERAGTPATASFFRASEEALDALEARDLPGAARRAGALLEHHLGDGPLLLILSRAAHVLMYGGQFDPVWEPPGK